MAKKASLSKQNNNHGNVSARDAALQVLVEVEKKEAYTNLVLNKIISKKDLTEVDRAFLTELSYGVIQRLNTLDWAISLFLNRSLQELTPWIRNILRLGTYQVLFLQRIPDPAAVDEAVKIAYRYGHKGVAGLVNAVLRKLCSEKENLPWPSRSKNPELYLSLTYSFPQWMVKRWIKNLGLEEAEAFCSAANHPPPLTVRTNKLKLSRDELKSRLFEEGVESLECRYAQEGLSIKLAGKLTELSSFREGLFQVQGEASMLVAPSLDPQPGERILDMCSAPGGKTIHLAMLMENKGKILAADLYPNRLKLVEEAAGRQGIEIIQTEKMDGRFMPSNYKNFFDRVLLDVPCSGLGVVRRKADLKWRRKEEDISSLAELQIELLQRAFYALRPGGFLVYSACTIEPEETVAIVKSFIQRESSASFDPLSPFLPFELKDEEQEPGMIYLWPHKHGLDGFFIARIKKIK